MLNYINSPFAALLGQNPNAPPSPYPVAPDGTDPLAPLALNNPPPQLPSAPAPDAGPPPVAQPDNPNDGISSVGRPADAAKALAKLNRQTKGDALMALGAELLGARNFSEGLSKGIMAYQQTIRANRPQVKAVGDGEYEEVTDPRTGQTYMRPTAIHADKLAERKKPVPVGNHVYQYGTDASGNYTGDVKDLAPPTLVAKTIKDPAGNESVVFVDEATGSVYDPKGANGPPPPQGATLAPASGSPDAPAPAAGGQGGFDKAMAFTLPHEGGLTTDVNGAPVNFGINAKFNPGVDVPHLTKAGATDIYKSKYWAKSGAATLDPAMQTPYFDTYVISPKRAQQFLAASGGDPNKFMDLREAWQAGEAQQHPYLARGIANRNRDLRATIGQAPAPDMSGGVQVADASGQVPVLGNQAPPAAPDNQWGLQPHDFSAKAPAIHFLSADEKKGAGYPDDAVVQRDARGMDHVMEKGTPTDQRLPDDAITQQAEIFRRTGKMPALGMGNPAVRDQIMAKAAAQNKIEGIEGGDIPAAQADYNNDVAARQDRNKQLSVIRPSLNAAIQHGNDALRLAAQIPAQTNLKLWNYVSQGILDQNSNPTLYAFQGAAKLAEAEVAKAITGNPNSGAGQLTDEARKEFKILEGPAGVPAKKKAWETLVQMMHQKYQAVQDEIGTIDGRMHGPLSGYVNGGSQPSSKPQSSSGNRRIVRTGTAKDGRKVAQYSDGTYGYLSN